jgi:hypothetical protein
MFLLPSLVLGPIFALLLGGDLSRLLQVRFRLSWTVLAALGIQLYVFIGPGQELEPDFRLGLHIGSYALLLLFVTANLRLKTMIPVLVGVALNAVAITANGGVMPVAADAAGAAGIEADPTASVSLEADRLTFLGDIFAIPQPLPLTNVFSIGDILIGFGMVAFIVVVATGGGAEPALRFGRLLTPFRTRSYRYLAVGKLVSHLGDWLTLAALVGWIYETTGSTGNVALLLLARLGPPILGASVAAVIVDRFSRRGLILWVELLRGAAVAVALVGVIAGSVPVVVTVLGVSGALAAVSAATVPALVPSLLPAGELAPANAGLGIARDGAMALGALCAGVALSWFGAAEALAVDLVSFVVAFLLFLGVKTERALPKRKREPGTPGGLRYLVRRRRLLLLVLSFAAATLATGLANATFPGFFDREFGLGSGAYGFAFAALATGLMLGQALVGFARAGDTAGRWIGAGLIVMAGFFVLLAVGTHLPTALLVIAAIGFVDGTTDVLFETFVQQEADPRYYGAIFGLSSAFMTTTMIGAIAAAPLLNELLEPGGVILGASVFLVVAGAIALVGMVRPPRTAWRDAVALPDGCRFAKRLRSGDDVSVITWGDLVPTAEAAADILAADVSVEIVSLPLDGPWNRTAVLRSVEKTSKAIVLHLDGPDERFAAEVAAAIAEQAFEHLDAPVRRVSVAHDDVVASVRSVAAY